MTETQQNIDDHTAGDTLKIEVTVTDDSGNAKDLTGGSVEWALADEPGETPIVEKSSDSGGVSITDATGGVFTITLDPADTADLSGVYYHEAELTDSIGNVHTVTTGHITIAEDTI